MFHFKTKVTLKSKENYAFDSEKYKYRQKYGYSGIPLILRNTECKGKYGYSGKYGYIRYSESLETMECIA